MSYIRWLLIYLRRVIKLAVIMFVNRDERDKFVKEHEEFFHFVSYAECENPDGSIRFVY
jgi:hypothetical protein